MTIAERNRFARPFRTRVNELSGKKSIQIGKVIIAALENTCRWQSLDNNLIVPSTKIFVAKAAEEDTDHKLLLSGALDDSDYVLEFSTGVSQIYSQWRRKSIAGRFVSYHLSSNFAPLPSSPEHTIQSLKPAAAMLLLKMMRGSQVVGFTPAHQAAWDSVGASSSALSAKPQT